MLNTVGRFASIAKTSGTHVAIFVVTFETATVIGKLGAIIRKSFAMPAVTITETLVGILTAGPIETTIEVTPELTIDPPVVLAAIIVRLPDDIFATDFLLSSLSRVY